MEFRRLQEAQERFGGPFAMTAILQKRVRELVQGSKPLVESAASARPIDIALDELLQGCLTLEHEEGADEIVAPEDIFTTDV